MGEGRDKGGLRDSMNFQTGKSGKAAGLEYHSDEHGRVLLRGATVSQPANISQCCGQGEEGYEGSIGKVGGTEGNVSDRYLAKSAEAGGAGLRIYGRSIARSGLEAAITHARSTGEIFESMPARVGRAYGNIRLFTHADDESVLFSWALVAFENKVYTLGISKRKEGKMERSRKDE